MGQNLLLLSNALTPALSLQALFPRAQGMGSPGLLAGLLHR